ncbi:hypothetical protein COLO4_14520 [Corchorus olitorius]|uniref:Histone deacetylase complex subunit SAP30 Sin3 binding domain-containing protein n=1 Tax=Corchorus olitorius TaxID=93759 RepID=A0A1R3JS14_9ROSI|nr:hypothetical protein COLO4_14520 [Corchorus olitorius]
MSSNNMEKLIKREERNKSEEQRFGPAMENSDDSAIGRILSAGPKKEDPDPDHDCLKEDESLAADQVFVNFAEELIRQEREAKAKAIECKDTRKLLKIKFKGQPAMERSPKEGHCSKAEAEHEAAAIENPKEPMVRENRSGANTIVDFDKLSTESLRNYCKHYKIKGVNSRSRREKLLNVVEQHFASYGQLSENQVIPEFVAAASSRRQKD